MRLSAVSRTLIVLASGVMLGVVAFAATRATEVGTEAVASTSTTGAATPSTTTSAVPTTTVPTSTTSTEARRGSLVVQAVGDVNTDPSYIAALGENPPDYPWSGLDGLFLDDDLTIVNLECAPSDLGEPEPKQFVFRCGTGSLAAMAAAGVEVANLGNNHSGDYGKEALVDGRANVAAAGVLPVGAGENSAQAHLPALIEVNGWRVAVLGFGGIYPTPDWFATADRPGMADGDDIETMTAAVRDAAAVSDLVVVTIHWGTELETEPDPDDRLRAEAMIEAGADMVFGHHAHRLQPLEVVEGVPVAWGLGNFVWPNFSDAGATTAVARVEVQADGSMKACLLDAFITAPGRPELTGDVTC